MLLLAVLIKFLHPNENLALLNVNNHGSFVDILVVLIVTQSNEAMLLVNSNLTSILFVCALSELPDVKSWILTTTIFLILSAHIPRFPKLGIV